MSRFTFSRAAAIELAGVLFVLLLVLVSQADLWFFRWLAADHDTLRIYSIFAYFANALQHGRLALWDPYLETGQPFFVVSPDQILAWQPWSLALIAAGKALSVNLLDLFHWHLWTLFALFTSGSYLFFRHVLSSRIAAFSAFSVLALSSLNTDYLRQPVFVYNVVLSPWLALSILKTFEQSSPRYLILSCWILGVATGSYHVLTLATFVGLLMASLFLTGAIKPDFLSVLRKNKRAAWTALAILALLSLRSFSQVYYLGDFTLILRKDVPLGDHSRLADFAGLVAPHIIWLARRNSGTLAASEAPLFIGLLPLFLAVVGITLSRNRYRTAFLATAGLLALLMLGPNTPAFEVLKFLPVFSLVRNTTDFHSFFIFSLCFFAGCGMDVLLSLARRDPAKSMPSLWWMGGGIALAALQTILGTRLGLSALSPDAFRNTDAQAILTTSLNLTGFYAFGAAATIWLVTRRRPHAFLLAALIFTLPDLLLAGNRFLGLSTRGRGSLLPEISRGILAPDRYADRRIPFLVVEHSFNVPALLRRFTAYHQKSTFGTHFLELKSSFELQEAAWQAAALDVVAGVSADKLRIVGKAVVMSRADILSTIAKIDPKSMLNFVFVEEPLPGRFKALEAPLPPALGAQPPPGSAKLESFEHNHVAIETDCEADCLLYYSDAYHRSWKATVDGAPAPILRANANYKAVPVPAGKHRVRFLYRPWLYFWALCGHNLGLVAGLICFAWFRV